MGMIGFGVTAAMLTAASAAAAQAPASGQREWVEVNVTEQARAYVDRRSIRAGGGSVRFEGRIVYARPDEDGVTELIHSGEIDCARREYRIIHFDALDAAGTVVGTHVAQDPGTPIHDGSPNAALHAEFCR